MALQFSVIHVRATKLIYGLDWYTPSVEVLRKVKWNTLRQMYLSRILCLVYKCVSGDAPPPLQQLRTKQGQHYNLRRKNAWYYQKQRLTSSDKWPHCGTH